MTALSAKKEERLYATMDLALAAIALSKSFDEHIGDDVGDAFRHLVQGFFEKYESRLRG